VLDFEHAAVTLGNLHRHALLNALVHPGENAHLHQLTSKLERLEPQRRGKVAHNHRRLEMNDLDVPRCDYRD